MTNKDAIKALDHIKSIIKLEIITDQPRKAMEALDIAIAALERDRWISDPQKFPNTDARVVGYFGGGALNQLRWFDFVTTLSDGRFVAESNERDVTNEHLIAVFQLPEPPKEET